MIEVMQFYREVCREDPIYARQLIESFQGVFEVNARFDDDVESADEMVGEAEAAALTAANDPEVPAVEPTPQGLTETALVSGEKSEVERGVFELVILTFLSRKEGSGADKRDILKIFRKLNLDVGDMDRFTGRLHKLRNPGKIIKWGKGRFSKIQITEEGHTWYRTLIECADNSPLKPTDRDDVLGRYEQLMLQAGAGSGGS